MVLRNNEIFRRYPTVRGFMPQVVGYLFSFLMISLMPSQALADSGGIPEFSGDVLDETGSLSQIEQATIKGRIQDLRDRSGVWMAVYFASSLHDTTIEDLGHQVFVKWKLGEKGNNNGLLFIAVPSARKMRLEVGYGLEPVLTDAYTKRLQEEVLVPAFRNQQYATGILEAMNRMGQRVSRGSSAGGREPEPQTKSKSSQSPWMVVLIFGSFFVLIPGLILVSEIRKSLNNGSLTERNVARQKLNALVVGFVLGFVGLKFFVGMTAFVSLIIDFFLFIFIAPSLFSRRSRGSAIDRADYGSDYGSDSGSGGSSSSDDSSSSGGGDSGGGGSSSSW